MAHETGLYHGYVALGCVLRGETTHYDIVANESARGIMDLTLEGLCIGNGILTCENEAQAWARAKVDDMDKGGGAAEAALAMIRFSRLMSRKAAGLTRKPHLNASDSKYPRERRSAARLGAVQALYQMDLSGSDVGETLAQFSVARHGREFRGRPVRRGRLPHLREVVDGVVREQKTIDPAVDQILDKAWPLHRLDSTVRAILRAGAYELMFMERVPATRGDQRICRRGGCLLRHGGAALRQRRARPAGPPGAAARNSRRDGAGRRIRRREGPPQCVDPRRRAGDLSARRRRPWS